MVASFRAHLIVEDRYGRPFFFELVERLKREGFLPAHVLVPKRAIRRLPGKCNPEIGRMVIAALKVSMPPSDRVVLVVDAEGRPVENERARVEQHIPRDCREKTRIVVLKYCVEEWVCVGLGITPGDDPEGALKNWLRKSRGRRPITTRALCPSSCPS